MKLKDTAKRIVSLVLAAVMVLELSSCGSGDSVLISYSLLKDPQNLDPQTASDSGAIMIINNTYEGLYRTKPDGSCEPGAASDIQTSDDGLTLTFTIRDNLYWKYYTKDNLLKDGTPFNEKVTAYDYLFGFQRLFDPGNVTPFCSDYYFIKNAKEVKEGKLSADKLGVEALSDTVLKITLCHNDPMMEELFASAPAMPCNEKFFSDTKGRYGMSGSMLISNGPFYVDSWSTSEDSNYVRIRKNDKYHDKDNVLPAGVNLTVRTQDEAFEAFKSTKIDTAVVTQSQRDELNIGDAQAQAFRGSVMGIGFNQNTAQFQNENIRKALAFDIDRNLILDRLPKNDIEAKSVVPPAVTIGKDSYRNAVPDSLSPDYQKDQAASFLQQGLAQLSKTNSSRDLNSLSVLVLGSSATYIEEILQTWQKDLNVFFKVDVEDQDNYLKKLQNGNFDCAFLTYTSDADSPYSVLSKFTDGSSDNYLNCNPKGLKDAISNAAQQPDFNSMANAYRQAEQIVIDSASFIPISFNQEYFVSKKGIEGLQFNPGSRQIYFPFIRKK